MNKDAILIAQQKHLFPAVFHYFSEPLVISRAKNQFVYDADGNEYLDFFGGIVTISVGHCNEHVSRRLHEQIDKLTHVSPVFVTEPQAALAEAIAGVTPDRALTKCFFTNSGTEANEAAILTARCYTGSMEVVALRHSYHGRSALTATMTGQSAWRYGLMPQPGIVHALNAYCYRCPFGLSYPECGVRCAQDVENVIRTTTSGRIAGFIAEPIQGVGGFITPPKEYFGTVAEIVRHYGGLLISDEVQTGWGRTGAKWFGIEQWGVVPDIITGAKGLGNGMPIGVTIARPEVADSVQGLTISTFGGNPLATSAAGAVLEYIQQNNLLADAETTGVYLRNGLLRLQEKHNCIGDVRGMGLLQAIELVEDRATKEPATALTTRLMDAAKKNRLLVGKGGMFGNCIRISPPMNVTTDDTDEFLRRMDASLNEVA
jgi:4-aminobutyrate aminotransferase